MRRIRFLIPAFMALLCVCCVPRFAAARTTTVEVADVREQTTHLFSFGWERGELSVTLIAPDGTRIPQDDPPAGVRVALGDRLVMFRVDDAGPGLWKAELNEYDNGKVGFAVQKLIHPLTVRDVRARQDQGEITVDFSLSGEGNRHCRYDVYLSLDGQYQNGRLLMSGTAETGQTLSVNCPAEEIGSYTDWIAVVYAQCEYNGFIDFDSASSAPFPYGNPAAPATVKNLTAWLSEGAVSLAWEAPDGEEVSGYLAVLCDENGEVLHSARVDAQRLDAILPVEPGGVVQAEVSAIRNTLTGLPAAARIDTERTLFDLLSLDLPEKPSAINGYVELAYDTGKQTVAASMEADGETSALTLTGGGTLRVPVHEGVNRVRLSAMAADGLWIAQDRRWSIDMTPPALRIYEDWDAAFTRKNDILLSGNAGGAQSVFVNDREASLEKNGNFSMQVPLARGLNTLTVVAADGAGNTAVYQARVTRLAAPFPWMLAGSLGTAALVITAYALSGKRRRRS